MLKNGNLTYVSLFSSAGVGCYGLSEEGFHCIATAELLDRRMDVQRFNHKCEFESGYIVGDLSEHDTKERVLKEVDRWHRMGNDAVDVLMATPPCQGISVINHKKTDKEIVRNSLVVESVELIKQIKPRFFIIENVAGFSKAHCADSRGRILEIGTFLDEELADDYVMYQRVLNFMNYGSRSSRTRTLVIGVSMRYKNELAPLELFPPYEREQTLREVIGAYPVLEWGEIDANDFYHAFRTYRPSMRLWIHDLNEGESAFDNADPEKRPHHYKNGVRVENVRKTRDKYTRQLWDRFPQCVTTRNDQLAAQNTIHPEQDRVLSIRELMALMSIPPEFRWVDASLEELNALDDEEKRRIYKQHEMNIRQCIGEAVPTEVIRRIAHCIREFLTKEPFSADFNLAISENGAFDTKAFISYIAERGGQYRPATIQGFAESNNAKRKRNAAYYTNRFIANELMKRLPPFRKNTVRILEPSVGAGNLLPLIFKRYEDVPHVHIDVVDIDSESMAILRALVACMDVPQNVTLTYRVEDFVSASLEADYDLVVGNPPFAKIARTDKLVQCIEGNLNPRSSDLAEIFLEKCLRLGDCVALIMNKTMLSSSEFSPVRSAMRSMRIDAIDDFGRKGFTGVAIETISLVVYPHMQPAKTIVHNHRDHSTSVQAQSYITDPAFPNYLIYRTNAFDKTVKKLSVGVFDVFRDRQITKKNTVGRPGPHRLWVLKGRNIDEDGMGLRHIEGYDAYIEEEVASRFSASQFLDDSSVYLTPNMTYKPRVIRNPGGVVPDGSVAVLIPRKPLCLSDRQLAFFASNEFREYYRIARNKSTQSINVDKTSSFYFGVIEHER